MKRLALYAVLAASVLAPLAHAAEKGEAAVRASVKKLVPNAQVETVEKSPIPGYYQVIVGSQLVYVSEDGRYVMHGSLYDAEAKLDLTAARLSREHVAKLDAYPASQRITFAPQSKPKYKITVFTDIDCGYCRKMHEHIAEYNARGIQVDYLFFPRSGPNTPSFDKAVSVWCAADRKQALTSAKAGQTPAPATCDNPIAKEYQLGLDVGVDGTPAVYAPDGSKIGGYLTPDQLETVLQRVASTAAAAKPGA